MSNSGCSRSTTVSGRSGVSPVTGTISSSASVKTISTISFTISIPVVVSKKASSGLSTVSSSKFKTTPSPSPSAAASKELIASAMACPEEVTTSASVANSVKSIPINVPETSIEANVFS